MRLGTALPGRSGLVIPRGPEFKRSQIHIDEESLWRSEHRTFLMKHRRYSDSKGYSQHLKIHNRYIYK